MSNGALKRLTAIITAAVMTLVVVLGVSWKSAVKTFTKPAEVKQTEAATQAVEVKQTTAETQAATQAAETQPATQEPPATTTVAETLPEGAATATATTADGTPITVVVQMPAETMPQQTVQQVVQQPAEDPNSEEALTKKALAATWIHYYNGDIQANGLWEDDFNFGPNPITDGVVGEASFYDAELRERLKWDPALAAAVTAWIDAAVGTRYLGVFYEAAKEDWATAINLAKLKFSADQMAYYKNLDALFAFMNSARNVEVRPCQGVTDMMYMNPYTPSGIPDVIVMSTNDQIGYELVYQFVIKPSASGSSTSGGNSNTFEVAFRLNCGFQPTNVAEIMKITPQPEPPRTPTPQTEAKKSTPAPSGGNNTPTPETGKNPTPTPTPNTEKQTETDPDTPTPNTEKQTETDPDTPTPETTQTETNPPEPTPETTQTETNPPEPTPQTETPPTTTPETDPPEPTPQTETPPTETPETLPVKDPSEQHAENAEPNDNQGVGESTNNGVGAEYSTADQPENSNHYESYDQYVEVVENLEQVNEEQKVGGDSNEPSYTPDTPPDNTDNNADTGTAASVPMDNPTPVNDLATAANTDEEIANDPTNPGVAWEGPPD